MATQPTNMPVPSESPRDLKFNAGKIDEFVTSQGWTYIDRFGGKHYTIEGINYLAQQVMNAFGYVTLTGLTFTTGATVANPNEVLFNTADNAYYKWTGSFASGPKVVPANSTPESTGGIGPGKWLSVGDTVLRSDLASPSTGLGDSLLTVKQPYAGAIATNQHEINKRVVNILDFGGNGDGVTDNSAALQSAAAAVGEWGTIYFPALGGLNYKLGTGTSASWTNNRILKTDKNVILSTVDGGYISSTARYASLVKIHYTNQDVYFYYPQSLGYDKADRPVWTSAADRDISTVKQIFPNQSDLAVGMYYRQFDQGLDTSTTVTPTATSNTGYVIANSDNNKQSIGFAPIADNEEFSCHFDAPSSGTTTIATVMVNCTLGRVWYNCLANDTANPVRNIRTGGSVITGDLVYQGMTSTPAYNFFMSDITLRRNSSTSFTLMLNGFAIDTVDVSSMGEIQDVGFGCGGVGNITVSSPTRRLNLSRDTGRFIHVCCFGDSISSDALGASWPSVLKTSFDAMNGIRLATVDNYSRPGDDSAAQRTIMDGVNLGNYNLCLMMVGVNDIQGGVTGSAYLTNMRYMINNAINNGNQVIVACPTIYYGQDQVGGKGQPTTRSGLGKFHRSGLRNLCAELGVKFIEMNQVIGPVFPDYITDPSRSDQDSTVNDNIHPTANTGYLFARAFYNSILGLASPGGSLNTSHMPLNGTIGTNWSLGSGESTPRWSRDSDGTVTLDGLLNFTGVGAPVNGDVIYTLPGNVSPRFITRQVVWADAVNARVIIEKNGQVKIWGMTSGTWVSLGGISFKGVV
ncbi:lysophospholipase L1-like esterase [Yokenella regensburgei]|uniref:Lysophospholipase L1-like esterase n=1 Tax=Yokenella regensburgei TaxID=158877 RepID=A0ABX9S285_9ENTR|nr:GDSL-type esterase/lipase family protein [Yokenella regensburgei]RKR64043.1 lysophospholipase L1-like esterase [Yokenella regensburgei]VFS25741.1 Pectate lyase superfamily protein [Yokenella regensburgei]